jgi:hypothetical protein
MSLGYCVLPVLKTPTWEIPCAVTGTNSTGKIQKEDQTTTKGGFPPWGFLFRLFPSSVATH